LEHGFTLLHVRDELVGSSLLDDNFQGTLPAFEEILAENLVYDIEDAQKVRALCPYIPCICLQHSSHMFLFKSTVPAYL
jgi:hypothetical protein